VNVFERLHSGEAIDIRDEDYQREDPYQKECMDWGKGEHLARSHYW
jgi:hypothetical protein